MAKLRDFAVRAKVCVAKEELEGESLDKWNSCVEKVQGIGIEGEDAEKAVGQAFGWGKQSYWLKKKKNEVPDPEKVMTSLLRRCPPISADLCELSKHCISLQGQHFILSFSIVAMSLGLVPPEDFQSSVHATHGPCASPIF